MGVTAPLAADQETHGICVSLPSVVALDSRSRTWQDLQSKRRCRAALYEVNRQHGDRAGSALFGMISGAAVSNVMAVGIVTIPLMSRSGFSPTRSATIESHFHRKSWRDIDPKLILSAAYSSGSGWENNVNSLLRRANILGPCGGRGRTKSAARTGAVGWSAINFTTKSARLAPLRRGTLFRSER